jgi:hypothetical protein
LTKQSEKKMNGGCCASKFSLAFHVSMIILLSTLAFIAYGANVEVWGRGMGFGLAINPSLHTSFVLSSFKKIFAAICCCLVMLATV